MELIQRSHPSRRRAVFGGVGETPRARATTSGSEFQESGVIDITDSASLFFPNGADVYGQMTERRAASMRSAWRR